MCQVRFVRAFSFFSFLNHENSRKHKELVQLMKEHMQQENEELLLGEDQTQNLEPNESFERVSLPVNDQTRFVFEENWRKIWGRVSSWRKSKKKKKKQKRNKKNDDSSDEADDQETTNLDEQEENVEQNEDSASNSNKAKVKTKSSTASKNENDEVRRENSSLHFDLKFCLDFGARTESSMFCLQRRVFFSERFVQTYQRVGSR